MDGPEKKNYSINLEMRIANKLKEESKEKYGNENLSGYINDILKKHVGFE